MGKQSCYHIWFATKNRKWLLVGEIEDEVKRLFTEIAKDKHIDMLACETMVDHIHLLLRIRGEELPRAMFLLKGISSRRVFQKIPDLKLDASTMTFGKLATKPNSFRKRALGR